MSDELRDAAGEAADERMLRQVLRRPALDEASVARISHAVEAAWRQTVRERRAWRRRWGLVACAAALAAFTLAGRWWPDRHALVEPVGALQNIGPGGLVARRGWGAVRTLRVGALVESGSLLRAKGTAVISLEGGGVLRLKSGTEVRSGADHVIDIHKGALYLDLDADLPHGVWSVRTPVGLVQHLGTQFEVAIEDSGLRLRVREGRVWLQGQPDTSARAGDEIVIADGGSVQRHAIAPDDPSWSWVQDPPTRFDVEGQPVLALLRWVARETGRQLDFADAHTRQLAEHTILHGSIKGFTADRALQVMLETTSLSAEIRAGHIIIHSSGGAALVRAR